MRSVRTVAFLAALLTAVPALAQQDSFPDVPRNHWAYVALGRMKTDGLLVGYPDGLYRGGRPMSRYELAVALHAAYTKLKDTTDALNAQIQALKGPNVSQDVKTLRDQIAELQKGFAATKGLGSDIVDLQHASDTFELELTQLGIDVQAMKDDLKVMAGRVAVLEKRQEPLEVHGEIDLWAGGGHTDGTHYGLTRDGRLTGTADKLGQGYGPVSKAGVLRDAAVLHEAAVEVTTTNETGLRFDGILVATNAFGQAPFDGVPTSHVAFGNQSDVFNPVSHTTGGALFGYAEGSGDLYLDRFAVTYEKGPVNAEFGRIEHKATPWILQRIDNTLYFDNERWDNGEYLFDGAKAATRLGTFDLEVYGGVDQERSVNDVEIDAIRAGSANGPFDPLAGGRLEAGRLLGGTVATDVKGVKLRGDALVLDGDEETEGALPYRQLRVYGAEAGARVSRFHVTGGLRETQAYQGNDLVNGLSGNAWDAKVAWGSGRYDLWAQYREVARNYLAPGDWGRLGILRDPTNVRGFLGAAKVGLISRLSLGLEGELSHGLQNDAIGTRLDRDTEIGRYAVRLDGDLGSDWSAYVRYESTYFSDLAGAATNGARYQWYGVGVGHALGSNARFSLDYEQSAVRNDYQSSLGTAAYDFRGGFVTTQVTVRF